MKNEEKRPRFSVPARVAAVVTAAICACALTFAVSPESSLADLFQETAYAAGGSSGSGSAKAADEKPSSTDKTGSETGKAATEGGSKDAGSSTQQAKGEADAAAASSDGFVTLDQIPEYSGSPYVELNGNQPYFDPDDYPYESFESYAPLDSLGRCGECAALVGEETMPTEKRGSIGSVKPSGWCMHKYDWVDGKYVYNRCHLLGYQLTAENANVRNLITGTRSMNVDGMEPFESKVAQYVKSTGNHVLYRVTPLFEGNELVARGVVMEVRSMEDDGKGLSFCIYCYNVEPGVTIDYASGENWADGTMGSGESSDDSDGSAAAAGAVAASAADSAEPAASGDSVAASYVLNTNSKKFHVPECGSVDQMSEANKEYFNGTRDEAIARGYTPCKRCNP
ncbi:MAG: DNA/RNA non-specific endonuclease [Eggerthellaceae bacterium]